MTCDNVMPRLVNETSAVLNQLLLGNDDHGKREPSMQKYIVHITL